MFLTRIEFCHWWTCVEYEKYCKLSQKLIVKRTAQCMRLLAMLSLGRVNICSLILLRTEFVVVTQTLGFKGANFMLCEDLSDI